MEPALHGAGRATSTQSVTVRVTQCGPMVVVVMFMGREQLCHARTRIHTHTVTHTCTLLRIAKASRAVRVARSAELSWECVRVRPGVGE